MLFHSRPVSGLLTPLTLLLLLAACGGGHPLAPAASASPAPTPATAMKPTLLVTHSKSDYFSFLDPASGTYDKLVVGRAPFAADLGPQHRAYVSTAEGIAVIDTALRKRLALVPYLSSVGQNPRYGEYRAGAMGLAVSPDGKQVYVGVYRGSSASQLEILDTDTFTMTARVPVGIRPFDVVVAPDGHAMRNRAQGSSSPAHNISEFIRR
ncbi:YncE family protein [Paenibacillus oryzisoli]|uniref:YncE family protein n=1 Tax=Paenibacillus oryzisoli TaxID=1850517 RepID=UPI003D284425